MKINFYSFRILNTHTIAFTVRARQNTPIYNDVIVLPKLFSNCHNKVELVSEGELLRRKVSQVNSVTACVT